MFKKKTLADIDVKDKTVLVRVDYNVPLHDGQIADDYRIRMSLDTIKDLLHQNCRIVLISHLGRPEGEVKPEFSLRPAAERLSQLLEMEVKFTDDCIGEPAKQAVKQLEHGQVLLLENLRFHPEEENNNAEFAKQLSAHGEVFVQDGFGAAHRAHASIDGVAKFLPSVAGHLLEKEVRNLSKAINHPKQPLLAIIGGAKIDSKIDLLESIIAKAKTLVIGGAMANTFLKAKEIEVGKSLVDDDELETAKRIMQLCRDKSVDLILPLLDVAVAHEVDAGQERREVETEHVRPEDIILDVGEKSVNSIISNVKEAGTVIWNGPLGMTEFENFRVGSERVARTVAELDIMSIIGGGDTADFVKDAGLMDKFTWVSTGGGASLELLSGAKLPGVEALLDK